MVSKKDYVLAGKNNTKFDPNYKGLYPNVRKVVESMQLMKRWQSSEHWLEKQIRTHETHGLWGYRYRL